MQRLRSSLGTTPRALAAASAAALVGALSLATTPADAAVGVEKVSRGGGEPGASVTLTLACGICYPRCVGPKGERHPEGFDDGPCMLGTKEDPPAAFGISLVPRSRAPQLGKCGTGPVCTPSTVGPPRRAPYRFLGRAVPPPGGNDPGSGEPPRYLLQFEIPDLRPGSYLYEVWCGVCEKGARGSLISAPESPLWKLQVRQGKESLASRRMPQPSRLRSPGIQAIGPIARATDGIARATDGNLWRLWRHLLTHR